MIPLMAGRELGWGINLEISALALWLAVLTHHLVENPSLRSRLRKPQWLVAGTGLTGATAAVAGVVVFTLPSLVGGGARCDGQPRPCEHEPRPGSAGLGPAGRGRPEQPAAGRHDCRVGRACQFERRLPRRLRHDHPGCLRLR